MGLEGQLSQNLFSHISHLKIFPSFLVHMHSLDSLISIWIRIKEACYTKLPMIIKTPPTDPPLTYAKMLSMELSPEELLKEKGIELN